MGVLVLRTSLGPEPILWSEWAEAPATDEDATIPNGTTILLDVVTASMGHLDIEAGGTLRLDGASNTQLIAASVHVEGALLCGNSVGDPFTGTTRITLTGAPDDPNDGVSRGIICEGTSWELKLYGNPPAVERVKLNATAAAAATSLTAASATGWLSGDEIAVGTSDFYEIGAPEKFTLGTNASGTTVTLPSGLARTKYGVLQYLINGSATTWDNAVSTSLSATPGTWTPATNSVDAPTTIDERSMMLNLSRNIVIESINDAYWTDDEHGFHLMMMGRRTSAVRLHGVRFLRGGQAGHLGRYPYHSHMRSYVSGDGSLIGAVDDEVTYCVVDQSKQRGFVTHGTNGATYEHCIVYDCNSHGFFVEDGSERDNAFRFCSSMWIKPAITGLHIANHERASADQGYPASLGTGPTGLWLTNPDNEVTDFYSSFCEGSGMWFSFGTQPRNLSENVDIIPRNINPGTWARNESHSNQGMGLLLRFAMSDNSGNTDDYAHFGPTPDEQTTGDVAGISLFTIADQKIWKNTLGGYHNMVVYETLLRWSVHSNMGMALSGVANTFTLESTCTSGVVVGYTLNNANLYPPAFASYPEPLKMPRGVATYHFGLRFKQMAWVNMAEVHDFDLPPEGYPLSRNVHSGAMQMGDLYEAGVEIGLIESPDWKFSNCYPGAMTLPPHLETVPDQTGQGQLTFSGAKYDPYHYFGANEWIIFDTPYLTHGTTGSQAYGDDAQVGMSVTRAYFGAQYLSSSTATTGEDRIRARRYDDALTTNPYSETPVGTYDVPAAISSGQTFGTKRFLSIPVDSIVLIDWPDLALPTTINGLFQALTTPDQKAKVGFRIETSGVTDVSYQDPDAGLRVFSSVGSWATFLASTDDEYWLDTTNDVCWMNLSGTGSVYNSYYAPFAIS